MNMQSLAPAIVYAMAKEGMYVPNTHPTVTSAVREAEKALAHGLPLKVAVAFAVNKANNNATAALSTAKLLRKVS
jgi:hypothetical protein